MSERGSPGRGGRKKRSGEERWRVSGRRIVDEKWML
jgi:hypothetical protein